jgi:hypothetical protein
MLANAAVAVGAPDDAVAYKRNKRRGKVVAHAVDDGELRGGEFSIRKDVDGIIYLTHHTANMQS